MSFIKEIGQKMNTVIKYLESSSTPSPTEPDNTSTILKAINELRTSIQGLDQKLTSAKMIMTEDPPSPKTYANATKANRLPPSEPRNLKPTPKPWRQSQLETFRKEHHKHTTTVSPKEATAEDQA
jgi:hypothetical protein